MARIDTLRLLLAADLPTDVEAVELAMREITARIDEIQRGTDDHLLVHRKLDQLLAQRDRLAAEAHAPA